MLEPTFLTVGVSPCPPRAALACARTCCLQRMALAKLPEEEVLEGGSNTGSLARLLTDYPPGTRLLAFQASPTPETWVLSPAPALGGWLCVSGQITEPLWASSHCTNLGMEPSSLLILQNGQTGDGGLAEGERNSLPRAWCGCICSPPWARPSARLQGRKGESKPHHHPQRAGR